MADHQLQLPAADADYFQQHVFQQLPALLEGQSLLPSMAWDAMLPGEPSNASTNDYSELGGADSMGSTLGSQEDDTERAKAELEQVLVVSRRKLWLDREAEKKKVLDEVAKKIALPEGSTRKRRQLKGLSEVEKQLVKMERNRQSAQRSRQRKRMVVEELQQQSAELLAELRRVCEEAGVKSALLG